MTSIGEDPDILVNLCIMGAIPAVMRCAARASPSAVRACAAQFIRLCIETSPSTLQMFIACKGLSALVGLLDAELYELDRELVWSAVGSVEKIFRLQQEVCFDWFCLKKNQYQIILFLSL